MCRLTVSEILNELDAIGDNELHDIEIYATPPIDGADTALESGKKLVVAHICIFA